MGQKQVILSALLILLLGFFSHRASFSLPITGAAVQTIDDVSYDLNLDGTITSADLQDVMDLASYEIYLQQADFNSDNVIDQADIDLLANKLR
ncbi:MAG TPA: hypothetical protein VJH37_00420 [Candidatus Nanoarchaeia archaeon]|nr:hypothetical protein [Candidatus Nanoarchaeia archaeon]